MNTILMSVCRRLLFGVIGLIVVLAIAFAFELSLLAAVTPEEGQKLKRVDALLKAAEAQTRAKKFPQAEEAIGEAKKLMADLEKVPEFANPLMGYKKRLDRLQSQAPMSAAKPAPQQSPNRPAEGGDGLPGSNLSFIKHIAPILVSKCGRCHVNDRKGNFNMATYELLKKGMQDGLVIMPGKGSGSRLVEVIESGDMPRGNGNKVSKPELDAITKWIDEGAKFDGKAGNTPLVRLVSSSVANAANMVEPEALKAVPATGKETVSFSKDIAPVLLSTCVECHTAAQQQGQFCMDNFNLLIKGGQCGNPWVPADAAESLLVKKLKGMVGQRMPLNRDPLPNDTIAKFEKWIAEGAKYDGSDPSQATPVLVRMTRIKTLTHEQLAKERTESSQEKWRLASPSGTPIVRKTKSFLLIGRVNEAVLDEVATVAEAQAINVARIFRAPLDKPLVKGGITLFVFSGRYDYSEFGRMVEERQLPPEWRGHFGMDSTDIFGVFVMPEADGSSDYTLAGVVGQQVAAAYVGSLSNSPSWFADGCGHTYAARIDPKATRVNQWNNRLVQVAANNRADLLLGRGLSPEDAEAAAYGFVKSLMNNSSKFNALLTALRNGEEFNRAFAHNIGPPKAVLEAWAKSVK